ncbi:MAG: hypothetical protein EP330_04905 [Deltaproteobacteria bacterium]|nr:MAG: hypothetical protein EP330_04905 [Deltaproteobacteria bacterium]
MLVNRTAPLAALLVAVTGVFVWSQLPYRLPSPGEDFELVALVVLDNVRADRTGLCGHARVPTPALEDACSRPGAACSCAGVSPAPWTLASHASYFTGLPVHEHGADIGGSVSVGFSTARPLSDDPETLAEHFRARGFQTLGISANPVVSPETGLARGFDELKVAPAFGSWREGLLEEELRELLSRADGDKPVFLFVNIIDAHEPWPPVPAGTPGFDAAHEAVFYKHDEDALPWTLMNGHLSADAADAEKERIRAVYDYAVAHADGTLGRVLGALDGAGWTEGRHRVVITSDHGELLGEEELLGHTTPVMFDGVVGVPFVAFGSEPAPALPSRVGATEAHALLVDWSLAGHPVASEATPNPGFSKRLGWEVHPGAAVWLDEDTKWLSHRGEAYLGDHSAARPLDEAPEALRERLDALRSLASDEDESGATDHLRALGYLE